MSAPEVEVSFRARLDPEAFQRAKPFIATANAKTLGDYQHEHEYVADFLLGMDAYAKTVGADLVAPLDAGIEFVDYRGVTEGDVTAPAAPVQVQIAIPEVWASLVGATVPKGSPQGIAALHDPRPHYGDQRQIEVMSDGVLVRATLAVDEFDDTYSVSYDATGPDGDKPISTRAFDRIVPDDLVLANTGIKVKVVPAIVPVKRSGIGYSFPDLLAIANRYYPEQSMASLEEHENLTAEGDVDYTRIQPGLERYLVVELFETFDLTKDKQMQLEEAAHALRRTIRDIEAVAKGLEEELERYL